MNRVAVVTGAASGVGAACAALLVERGWTVIGLDKNLPEPGTVLTALQVDVRLPEEVDRAFADIAARFAGIDALICSAGVLRVGPIETATVDDYDAVFDVNMRGTWLCARAALPLLRQRATEQEPAHIVFISSIAVPRPKIGTGIYAASKAALGHLTRVLAAEAAKDNILVNALAPGSMDTPMTPSAVRTASYIPSGVPPIGRKAVPADVARAAAMLLGSDAGFITGITISVDGGSSAAYIPGG